MTVGILGLGLIGGSMARAFSKAGHTVLADEQREDILSFAQLAGAVREQLAEENIGSCDLILLAIYPNACVEWLQRNAHLISPAALVMDLCGIKEEVCSGCFPLAEKYGFTFVGGHPMAGTQFSGIEYSRSDLFCGAPMVIVPPRYDDPDLIDGIKKLLAPCGFGRITITTAEEHDRIIAFTSQLAHVVSNAYVKTPTAQMHKGFSAGSYKDLTRVAWLNEYMWADLFLENKEPLLFEIDSIIASLAEYRDAIAEGNEERLIGLLRDGRIAKEKVDG